MRSFRVACTLALLLAVGGSAGAQKLPQPELSLPESEAILETPQWHTLDARYPELAPDQTPSTMAGGPTQQTATVITAQVFRDTDNTSGKGNDALLPSCTNSGNDQAEDTWYRVTLPQGGVITAWTKCAAPGFQTYDTRLGVFNESLALIACNDDACGKQSRISDLAVGAGTYYIVVDGWNGAEGPYELNVRWQGPVPCNGSNATTATVIPSMPYSDTRNLSNDCDDYLVTCELGGNQGGPDHWYRVTVDDPVLMDVTTTCQPALIDTRIAILDANQNQLYCNDNAASCGSGQSAIVDALLPEGTYYLIVDSAGLTGGNYTVQVNTTPAPPGSIVDLRPDIITRSNELYDYDIVTNIVAGRTHLRLSNATANIGLGKLYLWGVLPDNGDGTQDVRQRIWQSSGTYFDRDAGAFLFHPGHSHIHFEDWAIYRLRAVTAGGGVGAVITEGSKTSFCILDGLVHDSSLPGYPTTPEFGSCGTAAQGLSVGWGDIYGKGLEGQNIDITGVPYGDYWLESEADPLDHVLEINETNNVTRIRVTVGVPGALNPDAYEPNNSIADLNSRVVGAPNSPALGPCAPTKTVTGLTIHASGEDDYFRFYMPATGAPGDEVRIDFTNSTGNLDMQLLSASGVVLRTSAGSGNFERILMDARPAGWYDIRVYGSSGATSPGYFLTINPSQNATPTITVSNPPAGNTPVSETGTYTTTWSASDPDGNQTWVDVYVNTSPALNGNELLLPGSTNTPGAQGFYVINPAYLEHETSYYIYAKITDGGTFAGDWSTGTITVESVTAVEETPVTGVWRLLPPYPNPFNPYTVLRLEVRNDSHVSWRIYDARGALVRTLANGALPAGVHTRTWDTRDDHGRNVASGTYYMTVEAEGYQGRHKLTLVR